MTTSSAIHPDYTVGIWTLDAAHSELSFSVRHLAISKVRGKFETFDVTVVTGEDPKDITVSATIDIASVNTNQKDRDNHLRSSDFFLVEEHPTGTFASTSVTVDGEDFSAVGDLTLRGVTKSVTVKGELGGLIVDGYGRTKAGVSATAKINRKDFGVNWNAALEAGGLTLGDDVTLTFDIQLVLTPAA